jgi:hypothetical protein
MDHASRRAGTRIGARDEIFSTGRPVWTGVDTVSISRCA